MMLRHCTTAAFNFMKTAKTIPTKTLRRLNGFPKNHGAIRELSNATWSIAASCLSATKRQTSYKRFYRGRSINAKKSKPDVKHDRIGKRFYIADDNGIARASLKYEQKDQLIKIMHTEVPKEFGGRGYAKLLAKEALDFVARNDYQLRIHCKFVQAYVKKHAPEFSKYLK